MRTLFVRTFALGSWFLVAQACKTVEVPHEGATSSQAATQPDVAAAKRALAAGAILVDVRSRSALDSGHPEGAVNVPVDEIGARAPAPWPKDRALVVVCASR